MDTKQEKSCGVLLFTRQEGQPRYVVIQNSNGCYGFPKGHMEPGETEAETALRETSEEVGVRPALLPGFREVDEYPLPEKPGAQKRVVYFLGEYGGQALRCQAGELRGAWLLPPEQALALLQYERLREILRSADGFLREQGDER